MKKMLLFVSVLSFVLVLAVGCASRRAAVQPSVRLGITRVVLFQNGLAHIERQGVTENRTVELETRRDQVDDVLKSLTVVDRAGDQVTNVRVLPSDAEDDTVTLQVGLSKAARHDLRISYVSEMSGWRPTYRLVAEENGRVRVQGMAVVDNLTGEPWNDISLSLSTDLPLSFRYSLSEPRRAERPQLTNSGRLVQKATPMLASASQAPVSNIQAAYAEHNRMGRMEVSNRAGVRVAGSAVEEAESSRRPERAKRTQEVDPLSALDESDGIGASLLNSPAGFSLGNGESGLVPFIDEEAEGELVLLYKPSTSSGPSRSHPYHAVLFRNPLDAPLLTGPVAVYSDEQFLGDGVTGAIPAGAHAFVAFAMSPSVRIRQNTHRGEDDVRGVSVTGGFLTVQLRDTVRHVFNVSSTQARDERAFLFVPRLTGYEPRELIDGTISTGAGFFIPAPVGVRSAEVVFELVHDRSARIDISADPSHSYVPALLDLLASNADVNVSRLREIVDRVEELRLNEARWRADLDVRREALNEQREALQALRDVPANGALRRRLGNSVAEGVRQVDELTRNVISANAERVALRQEWYERLRELEVGR